MKTALEFFQSHPSLQTWLVDKPLEIGLTLLAAVVIHWLVRKAISKAAQVNSSFESNPDFSWVWGEKVSKK
ncbi:MAG: hypothetical protein Q4A31_10555 [Corynebacterium sp.]|uniref:hypothetical protein n=1 Tax=Corynebacterium sp. TaxID=1720 RepID=UPI0026DDB191|nr:hypothetical protein [Corynebacterium sp.]MDO4762348.1 hypothetical protein [Corynebacterium sp.]